MKKLLLGVITLVTISSSFGSDGISGKYFLLSGSEHCDKEVDISMDENILKTVGLYSSIGEIQVDQKEKVRNYTSPKRMDQGPGGGRHTVVSKASTSGDKDGGDFVLKFQEKKRDKPGDSLFDFVINKLDGDIYKTSYRSLIFKFKFSKSDEVLEFNSLRFSSSHLDNTPKDMYKYIELDDEESLRENENIRVYSTNCRYQKH